LSWRRSFPWPYGVTGMSFFNLFARLFRGGHDDLPEQPSEPSIDIRRTTVNIPKHIELEVSKAIEQLAFADRTYNLFTPIWPNNESKADWKHDLAVMRMYDDLKNIRLELLAADRTVPFEFKISFNGVPTAGASADLAKGVEIPILPAAVRNLVTDKRIVIGHNGKEAQYRHLLRNNWRPAPNHAKRSGDTYGSSHCQAITGGRQTGNFHVAAEARHQLVVYRCGTRGFAFAKAPNLGMADVYLRADDAPPGFRFFIGQRITAIIVQTPRGLQGRAIRAA
jgi:hypothetical protein